ncbi:MAG: MBL fold metallo-hydrolase [Myxococcota bacterium]
MDGVRVVLDAGTGLRALGSALGGSAVDLTLVFSHVHWDHIQGFPFFLPAFHPDSRLTLIGPPSLPAALSALMRPPTFPLTLSQVPAALRFEVLDPTRRIAVGSMAVSASPLHHPDGVQSIRVETDHRAVVYATDHEHGETLDERLIAFAEGADLLIHDAQYTDAEYPQRRGWGHSTWQQAVAVAQRSGAARLALFHHDPDRSDEGVDEIERAARQAGAGCFAARQGAELTL